MGIVVGVCGIVGEPGGKIVFEILFGRQLFLGVGVIAGRGGMVGVGRNAVNFLTRTMGCFTNWTPTSQSIFWKFSYLCLIGTSRKGKGLVAYTIVDLICKYKKHMRHGNGLRDWANKCHPMTVFPPATMFESGEYVWQQEGQNFLPKQSKKRQLPLKQPSGGKKKKTKTGKR